MKTNVVTFGIGALVGAVVMAAVFALSSGVFSPQKVSADAAQGPAMSPEEKAYYVKGAKCFDQESAFLDQVGSLINEAKAQFDGAKNDARQSCLESDLQTMRSQMELYKVQHLDRYPSPKAFTDQLLGRTNADGDVMQAGQNKDDFPFGPYLQHMPANPFIKDKDHADKVKFGKTCPFDGTSGWFFETETGKFCANDSAHKDL